MWADVRLSRVPPALPDALVIDLNSFDPSLGLPRWDGEKAVQGRGRAFPSTLDLKVIGHNRAVFRGKPGLKGGRNIVWIGGTYAEGPYASGFFGDIWLEGILTRFPFRPEGMETGDSFGLFPHSSTLGQSSISLLNCRVENVDGFYNGNHGDCFQIPSQYDPPKGFSATPRAVHIERFTGSTGYQGFFLPNQHFDAIGNGYSHSLEQLTLIDVNLRQTRKLALFKNGKSLYPPPLIYFIDMSKDKRGDRPYRKYFRSVYLEPFAGNSMDDCIFPSRHKGNGFNPSTRTRLIPMAGPESNTIVFPQAMLLDGEIRLGPPANGDFAAAADARGRGGWNIPGAGYISPGYVDGA